MSERIKVEEALQSGDHAKALSLALTAWSKSRDATLAEAVDAISKEACKAFTAPEDLRTNAEFQKHWLATLSAQDPTAGVWLADTLFAKLPGSDMDGKQAAFLKRVRALEKFPDPRFARALMTLCEQGAPIVNWSEDACRKTLTVIGDARTRAAIEARIASCDKKDAKRWAIARDKLPKVTPLTEADQKAWNAIGPRTSTRATGDRDALLAAVYAAVDREADEQAREVLADCLQEQGDPRGEFIAIQLAEERGTATLDASKRADALLKKHKKQWLGALTAVTYRAKFRRGFLDELDLDGTWKASAKQWVDHTKNPLLQTVTKIEGKPKPEIIALFVASPTMRSLREVVIYADPIMDAIEKHPPPALREVSTFHWTRHDANKRFRERVLPFIVGTPSVDTVGLNANTLDALMESRAWKRISTLSIGFFDDDEGKKKDDVVSFLKRLPSHITTVRCDWSHATFRRKKGSVELYISTVTQNLDDLNDLWLGDLRKLDGLTKVDIQAPAKRISPKALDKIKRKGLEITVREPTYRSGLAGGMGG